MQNRQLKQQRAIKNGKIGVLLLNLGTPDATDYFSVRRYLSEFLSDTRVIDYPKWFWQPLLQAIILTSRPFKSGHAYRTIWDKKHDQSPLLVYTRLFCEKLSRKFKDYSDKLLFGYGMCYGNPSTKKAIKGLLDQGCTKILLFALYPQYSATTTAAAYDKAFDYLKTITWQPAIRTAPCWFDDDNYITLLADSINRQLTALKKRPEVMIVSFHGLPKRYSAKGDPYYSLCLTTSELIRKKLSWASDSWITSFQSRFGPEEWLQPYTDEKVTKLAKKGVKRIAVISPAFVCDCLETLEELALQVKDIFLSAGGQEYTYIPCLNDSAEHINLLAGHIKQELRGWIQV